eukprot:6144959-Amphidinium_carterae.1
MSLSVVITTTAVDTVATNASVLSSSPFLQWIEGVSFIHTYIHTYIHIFIHRHSYGQFANASPIIVDITKTRAQSVLTAVEVILFYSRRQCRPPNESLLRCMCVGLLGGGKIDFVHKIAPCITLAPDLDNVRSTVAAPSLVVLLHDGPCCFCIGIPPSALAVNTIVHEVVPPKLH